MNFRIGNIDLKKQNKIIIKKITWHEKPEEQVPTTE
jgi:hypothetical protein